MAKKYFQKALSVGLSLALCAGLVAPSLAQSAYFYGDLSTEEIEQIKETDSDFNAYRPKNNPNNGGWVFLGEGEAPNGDTKEFTNGELSEGYTAPAAENADGTQTVSTTQVGDVTVKPFHDLGAYKYDDGAEGTEVGQYSYTVVWTEAKAVDTGATLQGSETTEKTDEGKIVISGSNTINVDGDIQLHKNQVGKVVINGFNEETGETDSISAQVGEKYIRDAFNLENEADKEKVESAITDIISGLQGFNMDNYVEGELEKGEDGQFVKTYTEITYEVTYNASDLLNFAGVEATKFGKVNGHTELGGLGSVYVPGRGTYTFGGWNVAEVDGNLVYTAVVNYIPEYDFGTTTIDEPAVPLAAGPVTRAEFIDYLWRHENEPENAGVCTFTDVTEEHEYFAALCWAEENGVAEAYFNAEGHEDGTFEPDELVTVAAVREFLDNFARVFGTNAVAAADLTSLIGDDDEAVLNCDEVLAEFFGEEYIPAGDEDEAA